MRGEIVDERFEILFSDMPYDKEISYSVSFLPMDILGLATNE